MHALNQLFWPVIFLLIAVAVVLLVVGRSRAAGPARALSYSSRPILNASEGRLYQVLERWRRENARHLNLSVQVAYGSFLSAEATDDWRKVAAKHADFVFWGKDRFVKAVIEYDGAGHYGSSREEAQKVAERDRVKDAAVSSANIPLIRIPQNASEADIRATLAQVLTPSSAPQIVAAQAVPQKSSRA